MRIKLSCFAFFIFSAISINVIHAQTLGIGCVDGAIRQQALDMKRQWINQGFTPLRDAMIGMESKKPFDMVVPLKQGVFYQVIFIGNALATYITLEMYDDTGIKIGEKTVKRGDNDPNYISMSFTPAYSGNHKFSLSQKVKGKTSCSGFLIMELKPVQN